MGGSQDWPAIGRSIARVSGLYSILPLGLMLILEHSNVCAGIPELPGITRNYLELGGTGSS